MNQAPKRVLRRTPVSPTSGFTLIEMLIVIGISIVLSAIMIVSGSSSRQQIALSTERVKVAQVITRAKSMALNSFSPGGNACGYGVRFVTASPQRYELVRYDSAISPPLPAQCDTFAGMVVSSTTGVVESYPLSPGVRLVNGANQIIQVVFVPPDPKTLMLDGGNNPISPSGSVFLQTVNGSSSGRVDISIAGQITY